MQAQCGAVASIAGGKKDTVFCDVAFVRVLRHGAHKIHPSTGCRCWYYVALAYVAAPHPFQASHLNDGEDLLVFRITASTNLTIR
jgi:hypothetical protein